MPKVSKEVAVEELERLAAAADVNIDVSEPSDDEEDLLVEHKAVITAAIESGLISVDEKGQAVLNAESGPITFRVPQGEDLMIMANAREDRQMEAMSRFVCSITGKDTRTIGKLKKKEWKLAMRIAGFLSAD